MYLIFLFLNSCYQDIKTKFRDTRPSQKLVDYMLLSKEYIFFSVVWRQRVKWFLNKIYIYLHDKAAERKRQRNQDLFSLNTLNTRAWSSPKQRALVFMKIFHIAGTQVIDPLSTAFRNAFAGSCVESITASTCKIIPMCPNLWLPTVSQCCPIK